jgi:hypothetical protein
MPRSIALGWGVLSLGITIPRGLLRTGDNSPLVGKEVMSTRNQVTTRKQNLWAQPYLRCIAIWWRPADYDGTTNMLGVA